MTDFVFILNDASAVKTFAQAGSLTFGGNVSIAAGPVGRNAEAAGAASLRSVAGIFSYSKTKGLFAGVSLEGSGMIERRDANEKLYGRRWTARELLGGQVPPPPAAEPLMRVLNSRVFAGVAGAQNPDAMYNDIPVYDDAHDDVVWNGRRGSAMGEGVRTNRTGSMGAADDDYVYRDRPSRASTWQDDVYDRQPVSAGVSRSFSTRANPNETFDRMDNRSSRGSAFADDFYGDRAKPGRPTAPKPVFRKQSMGPGQAIAKFTFDADQPGDLGFKKGEIITIIKKTESEADWWTGRIGDREGIFPRYVTEQLYGNLVFKGANIDTATTWNASTRTRTVHTRTLSQILRTSMCHCNRRGQAFPHETSLVLIVLFLHISLTHQTNSMLELRNLPDHCIALVTIDALVPPNPPSLCSQPKSSKQMVPPPPFLLNRLSLQRMPEG